MQLVRRPTATTHSNMGSFLCRQTVPYCYFLCLEIPHMRDSALFSIAHAQAPELLVTVYLRCSYFLFTCYLTSFCPTSFGLDGALHCAYCRRYPALLFYSRTVFLYDGGKAVEQFPQSHSESSIQTSCIIYFGCRDRHRVFNQNNSDRLA